MEYCQLQNVSFIVNYKIYEKGHIILDIESWSVIKQSEEFPPNVRQL